MGIPREGGRLTFPGLESLSWAIQLHSPGLWTSHLFLPSATGQPSQPGPQSSHPQPPRARWLSRRQGKGTGEACGRQPFAGQEAALRTASDHSPQLQSCSLRARGGLPFIAALPVFTASASLSLGPGTWDPGPGTRGPILETDLPHSSPGQGEGVSLRGPFWLPICS